ncbi:hypothetical protein K8B33_02485 [Alcanivorax sp. JB21]|uniref:hypothetical protein n=1 Tax=Alcanivorax limicola TaxID=2874102 RepID=UPI001CBB63A1|nr:hypothetical protein [Alcanivorax limicola]MBZ2187953.1 hypothetical protein [Alcanivorax limicola]
MTDYAIRMAFPASPRLEENLRHFISQADAEPETAHLALLEAVGEDFVSDLLAAFFDGPIDAVGAEGSVVSMIHKGVKVINKAARALLRSLLGKTGVAEQGALAAHFRSLMCEQEGQLYMAFPLDGTAGDQLVTTFRDFLAGQAGQTPKLVESLKAVCDGALVYFLDALVACVPLNAFNRGMVATARGTIRKAAYMAIEKGLPAMGREQKEPVVLHFQNMLSGAG